MVDLDSLLAQFDWLDWPDALTEMVGSVLGAALGALAGWLIVFRRKLNDLYRFQVSDSDDVLFQMHALVPTASGEGVVFLFRNVAPVTTVNHLYDNPEARKLVKSLADKTTLKDSVLQTGGVVGFEVLNDAFNYVTGHLAAAPFPREDWLFVMTCEARRVVRKRCVRCFLIRPRDLEKFLDWEWCREQVWVEKPWHRFRVVAMHQIARLWQQEQQARRYSDSQEGTQVEVLRVREMYIGIHTDERPVGKPEPVPWDSLGDELTEMGLPAQARAKAEL